MPEPVLKPIEPGSAELEMARALNEEAFPPNERVSIDYLLEGLEGLDQQLLGIYDEGRFSGFISTVTVGRCAYINFFAICPDRRGRGLGGRTLRQLIAGSAPRQVVVDFEAPDVQAENNAQRLRRRAFYLRNGFFPTGYFQYYMDTEFEIVCNQQSYDRAAYEGVVAAIHARVEDFDPKHYRKD